MQKRGACRPAILFLAGLVLAGFAGCSKNEPRPKTLSQRMRDSILATEPLPGAGVVGGALMQSNNLENRAAMMNAQVDSLPH